MQIEPSLDENGFQFELQLLPFPVWPSPVWSNLPMTQGGGLVASFVPFSEWTLLPQQTSDKLGQVPYWPSYKWTPAPRTSIKHADYSYRHKHWTTRSRGKGPKTDFTLWILINKYKEYNLCNSRYNLTTYQSKTVGWSCPPPHGRQRPLLHYLT